MIVHGVDFTSRPSRRKPITWAVCRAEGEGLVVQTLDRLETLEQFEQRLSQPGPWVGGFDFPFSLPRAFLTTMGWPLDWGRLMQGLDGSAPQTAAAMMDAYRKAMPAGAKHPLRATDALHGAQSPIKLYFQPVGRMFLAGAPCLWRAGLSVPPLRRTDADRVALEAYPGSLARSLVGRAPYKNDTPGKQTAAQAQTRARILEALPVAFVRPQDRAACLDDPGGDCLDAVLAALQAAHAARLPDYGIPADADPLEGWIIGPTPKLKAAA